ncbi:MAG: hypothetical protein ACI857_001895 [Arenicella sp.]
MQLIKLQKRPYKNPIMKKLFLIILTFFTIQVGFAQCTGYDMTITSNEPTCFQFSDGSLTVLTTGGNGGDVYTITDALGNQINVVNISNNLTSGWYYISVIDNMGCIIEDSIFIDQPEEMNIDFHVNDLLCFEVDSGSVVIDSLYNATGDPTMASYFWSPNPNGTNGIGQDSTGGLFAGTYNLTVNDENGCSNVWGFYVIEPDELVFSEFGFEACTGGTNGIVYMAGTGGTPDYTYIWTDLSNNNTTGNTVWGGLSDGCYEGTVIDDNGCVLIDTTCVSCLSVEELSIEISIYPNPSKGIVTLEGNSNEPVHFNLIDLSGSLIFTQQNYSFGNQINIEEVPTGFYLIQLEYQDEIGHFKLIVD